MNKKTRDMLRKRWQREGFRKARKLAFENITTWLNHYERMNSAANSTKLELGRVFAAQDILESIKMELK